MNPALSAVSVAKGTVLTDLIRFELVGSDSPPDSPPDSPSDSTSESESEPRFKGALSVTAIGVRSALASSSTHASTSDMPPDPSEAPKEPRQPPRNDRINASCAPHRLTASGRSAAPLWTHSCASVVASLRASAATSGSKSRSSMDRPASPSAGTPQRGPTSAAAVVTTRVAFAPNCPIPRSIAAPALAPQPPDPSTNRSGGGPPPSGSSRPSEVTRDDRRLAR